VLWTRDRPTKKRKRWCDGFLSELPSGGARFSLRNEEGRVLGSGCARGAAAAALEDGEEVAGLIDNVVVQVDATCPRAEVPGLMTARPVENMSFAGSDRPPPDDDRPRDDAHPRDSLVGYSNDELLKCLLVPADKPLPPPARTCASPLTAPPSSFGRVAGVEPTPAAAASRGLGGPSGREGGPSWGKQRQWQPTGLNLGARRPRAVFKPPRPAPAAGRGPEAGPGEVSGGAGTMGLSVAAPLRAHESSSGGGQAAALALGKLQFPALADRNKPLVRSVTIPNVFDDAAHYRRTVGAALAEEMEFRLRSVARAFGLALAECQSSDGRPVTGTLQEAEFAPVKSAAKRRGVYVCRAGLRRPRREREGNGIFLELGTDTWRPTSSAFSKGDVWVLSNNPVFTDKHAHWARLCRSVWHCPSADGVLEVQPFRRVPGLPAGEKKGKLFAIHAPGFTGELAMLDNLFRPESDYKSTALMPALLLQPSGSGGTLNPSQKLPLQGEKGTSRGALMEGLNSSQLAVLASCEAWLDPAYTGSPVSLVHGPFGSGKSTLLVRLIEALTRPSLPGGGDFRPLRVMVCANTNVAVDRILEGLAERPGAPDFLRVGSLRNISMEVIPSSIHAARAKGGALDELRFMLEACSAKDEVRRAQIQAEISRVKRGAERDRKRKVTSVSVLGVTCASCHHEVLQNAAFDVLILDECSQMVEPLSLLPILTAKPRFLVAAGDPKQLPPILSEAARGAAGPRDLGRPLFQRLADAGYRTSLLDTQYRCHPAIAGPANRTFYGGKLRDGVCPEDRPPLLSGLPPLAYINVATATQTVLKGFGKSIANRAEAETVARLVRALSEHSVRLDDVGVICLFRAQAQLVQECVTQSMPNLGNGGLTVATVDSFQGQEREVIILTTAVTSSGGFSSDGHRINVALTRARSHLILVGCAPALQDCPFWGRVLPVCEMCPKQLFSTNNP